MLNQKVSEVLQHIITHEQQQVGTIVKLNRKGISPDLTLSLQREITTAQNVYTSSVKH